jgi:hypothetical protein
VHSQAECRAPHAAAGKTQRDEWLQRHAIFGVRPLQRYVLVLTNVLFFENFLFFGGVGHAHLSSEQANGNGWCEESDSEGIRFVNDLFYGRSHITGVLETSIFFC